MFQEHDKRGNVGEIQTLSRSVTRASSYTICVGVFYVCVYFFRFVKGFEIIEYLGHGSFGSVYKVKDTFLKKFFAVKIVRYQR